MSKRVTIKFDRIDWELLREQKLALICIIKDLHSADAEAMQAILAVIDYIQDYAVDSDQCAEEEVFGKLDED